MSEQRLEGFAKAKTATPFIASEQERHDNTLNIGGTCHVILNLFQDLIKKRSRNKCGMTEFCHCEAERSEAVAIAKSLELNGITTSCATPRNDKYVSEAHRKELNVLTSYRLNDFKKKAGATHVDMSDNIRRVAFTLAEVLITLGIIGIVAAMTIPTLVQNYKKKVVETKLAKVYSVMNQAIKMSTIDNGDTTTWKYLADAHVDANVTYEEALDWYNTYLADYLRPQKVEKVSSQGKDYLGVYFSDGSALLFALYIYDIFYYIDTKTIDSAESQYGKDKFLFRFFPKRLAFQDENNPALKYSYNPGFASSCYDWDGTYEGAKHSPNGYGCFDTGTNGGKHCSKLIELNHWKIPDDYPFKF